MSFGIFAQSVFHFVGVFVYVDPVELRRVVRDGRDIAFPTTTPFGVGVGKEIAGEEVTLLGNAVITIVGQVFVSWVDVGHPELLMR